MSSNQATVNHGRVHHGRNMVHVINSSNSKAYYSQLMAFIPRHWTAYTPLLLIPIVWFINMEGGTIFKKSGHFFLFWFIGIYMAASFMGTTVLKLTSRPMVYCMPAQQGIMRRVIVAIGLFASLFFFLSSTLPAYSYWAPQTAPARISLIPIGLMIYLVVVATALWDSRYLIMVNLVYMATFLSIEFRYFHGPGPDITRLPLELYGLLTLSALVVIPLAWKALGSRRPLRRQIGAQRPSHPGDDVASELKKVSLFLRSSKNQVDDFSVTKPGTRLLSAIAGADGLNLERIFLAFIYRMRSANETKRVFSVWLSLTFIGVYLATIFDKSFSPVVLYYTLMLLATFQGAVLFRPMHTPFLPLGRRAYFVDCLINAFMRYVLVAIAIFTVLVLSFVGYGMWPNELWSQYLLVILVLPIKSTLYCLLVVPIMLFIFHVTRSLGWVTFNFVINLFAFYNSPHLAQWFSSLSSPVVISLMIAVWFPFLFLSYRKSFKFDHK